MADIVDTLRNSNGDNVFPIAGGMKASSIVTSMIQNNAVTSDKIDWSTIWDNNKIVQTITDSSNRTGLYFQDGTLITYRKATGNLDITTAWGSWYYGTISGNYSLAPSSGGSPDFYAEPIVQVTAFASNTRGFILGNYTTNAPSVISSKWAINNVTLLRPTSQTGVNYAIEIVAIGRWKA